MAGTAVGAYATRALPFEAGACLLAWLPILGRWPLWSWLLLQLSRVPRCGTGSPAPFPLRQAWPCTLLQLEAAAWPAGRGRASEARVATPMRGTGMNGPSCIVFACTTLCLCWALQPANPGAHGAGNRGSSHWGMHAAQ